MELLETILLGIIQGIAEFLPISSSAHLILFRDLFGIGGGMSESLALTFDLALHLGTFFAILVFFFQDFWTMFIKGVTKGAKDKKGKMMWYLIAATIPAGLVGALFEETIEKTIRTNYLLIAIALAVMGVIIYVVDKGMAEKKDVDDMTLKDAILIGCSQIFALIPGFSRSGTTIAAGRALSLKREDAAKFSFYLSAPIILGAACLQLLKEGTLAMVSENLMIFVVGILTSFIIGLLTIGFLLKFLKKHDFKVFMWYRIALAVIVITWILVK